MRENYLEFDELGMKAIYCMVCLKEIVAQRKVVEVNGAKVVKVVMNSSYNKKLVNILNDGKPSTVTCICCNECVKYEPDSGLIANQVVAAARASLKAEKWVDKDIDMFIKRDYNLTEEKKVHIPNEKTAVVSKGGV